MQFWPKAVKSNSSQKPHPIRNFLAAAALAGGIMLGVSGCGTGQVYLLSEKTGKYVNTASSAEEKPFNKLAEDRIVSDKGLLRCEIRGKDTLIVESIGASESNNDYTFKPEIKMKIGETAKGGFYTTINYGTWSEQRWVPTGGSPTISYDTLPPVTIATRLDTLVLGDELKAVGADRIAKVRWNNLSKLTMAKFDPNKLEYDLYHNSYGEVCYNLPAQILSEGAVADQYWHLLSSESTPDAFKEQLNLRSLPMPTDADMARILNLKGGEKLSLKLDKKSYLLKMTDDKPQPLDMYEISKDSCVLFLELTKGKNQSWKSKISKPESVEPIIELQRGNLSWKSRIDLRITSIYPGKLRLEVRDKSGKLAKTIDADYTAGETILMLDMSDLPFGSYTFDKLPGFSIYYPVQ
jgi:hypothetical protein